MTQASETDPLVVAILSVSLTLIVGLAVAFATALLARTGEHAKWVRERRYEAYVAFMVDMATITAVIETKRTLKNASKLKARIQAFTEKSTAAFEAVSLLGPRDVNAAGQKWVWAAAEYAATKAAPERSALSAARWKFLMVAGKFLQSKNVASEPMTQPGETPVNAAGASSR